MILRSEYEHEVEFRRNVEIPMRDGTLLSANIWLPVDADQHPVPALIEYLPYRKGDWTSSRDWQRHPWYAGHGYASLRIDMRGSGDSEGVMLDEYAPIEQQDAVDAINWIAAQPWCSGTAGMFGISWGGFNALQVAALRPEPLKAIVTVCSTDDRYADDVHYFGGGLLSVDMVSWATTMLAFTARPPDPTRVPNWRELWQQRLDAISPLLDTWLAHQERDDYWRHGSVCEDYSQIEAAVLAVGGWSDPYRNTVLRLLESLDAPAQGLVGPWPHQYPDIDKGPGPNIGFLQETLAWWDHWLKGVDNGVERRPALRAFLIDSHQPEAWSANYSGRWVAEDSYPTSSVTDAELVLADLVSAEPQAGDGSVWVRSPQHIGLDSGRYFPFGNKADLPTDQREEDGRSVTFDTPVLEHPYEILGWPRISATVRAQENQLVFVRLCDVAPDGTSTLVTRGCLNLAKRESMAINTAVVPGEPMEIAFGLTAIGWTFQPGHRIRVAFSTSYFPWMWPLPGTGGVRLDVAKSSITLPQRDGSASATEVVFEEAEQNQPLSVVFDQPDVPLVERLIEFDPAAGVWRLTSQPNYGGRREFPDGLVYDENAQEIYEIAPNDPLSALATSHWMIKMNRKDWQVAIEVTAKMRATEHCFLTEHTLTAWLDEQVIAQRSWNAEIPRSSV
jgi:uncharacterized protein